MFGIYMFRIYYITIIIKCECVVYILSQQNKQTKQPLKKKTRDYLKR